MVCTLCDATTRSVSGETHHLFTCIAGKSTQVPQFLVEAGGWAANNFQIACTQPRRIATITLAQRVAEEAGTRLGDRVGYSVRFDNRSSDETQIKYLTDDQLLHEAIVDDPLFSRYSVVMVSSTRVRCVANEDPGTHDSWLHTG